MKVDHGSDAITLAVEVAPGKWEVPQFGIAELIAPESYRLSHGCCVGTAALGHEANWRVGPALKTVRDHSYRALSFTPERVGLRPFSVGHIELPWRTALEPGALVLRWTRLSQALAADG